MALTRRKRENQPVPVEDSRQNLEPTGCFVIAALCFGALFGLPFIVWGLLLIFDRSRTWQKKLVHGKANVIPQRTRAWDIRQIIYGTFMVIFGAVIIIALSLFNYAAQRISPPPPF